MVRINRTSVYQFIVRLVSVLMQNLGRTIHGFGQHIKKSTGAHAAENHTTAVFIGLHAVIHTGFGEDGFQPQRVLQLLGNVNQNRLLAFEEWRFLFHSKRQARRPVLLNHLYAGVDFFAGDQGRPVGYDFADRRAAVAETGCAGRAVEHQRDQFAGESVHGLLVRAADADAQLDLGRIGIGWSGGAVAGVDAEVLGADFVEGQAKVAQALAHHAVGGARLIERLRPGVNQGADGLPAVGVAHGKLQRGRPPGAANAPDAHTVRTRIFQVNAGEIGDAIGRDVILRIAQLVEQLFLDAVGVDAASRGGVFGDAETAVGFGLDDGVADVRHVGDGLPIHLAVAAGALRAALDDVAGDGSSGQFIVVVGLPA